MTLINVLDIILLNIYSVSNQLALYNTNCRIITSSPFVLLHGTINNTRDTWPQTKLTYFLLETLSDLISK